MSCFKQALFVLVWFRESRDVALTGHGFGIFQATAYRYLDEAIEVLAAQASELTAALERVADEGWSHVVQDGKVVASDHCQPKQDRRNRNSVARPRPFRAQLLTLLRKPH